LHFAPSALLRRLLQQSQRGLGNISYPVSPGSPRSPGANTLSRAARARPVRFRPTFIPSADADANLCAAQSKTPYHSTRGLSRASTPHPDYQILDLPRKTSDPGRESIDPDGETGDPGVQSLDPDVQSLDPGGKTFDPAAKVSIQGAKPSILPRRVSILSREPSILG